MIVGKKRIWIDMDNSPHVPFFRPIIVELEKRGYSVVLTARDAFQVCELANMYQLKYEAIGSHSGKNIVMKTAGLFLRALQLLRVGLREQPIVAVSHGSRAQLLAAMLLRMPSISMDDYEHSREIANPTWMLMPDVIPESSVKAAKRGVLRYPGIKEDVYVPFFEPDRTVTTVLGVETTDLLVTIRPPAIEAHYHNPLSQELFEASMAHILSREDARVVVLPRSKVQKEAIERVWRKEIASRRVIIPQQAIDGLSLIWYSDLVISGGGTMNREAAALAVPVYSIFRGTIGAVDQYLCSEGRLTLIETVEDVPKKIALIRREKSGAERVRKSAALERIIEIIDGIAQGKM
jgi:predicted glycosyltransferase